MAEWSNAAVLKTAEPETVPGVRIPLLPPLNTLMASLGIVLKLNESFFYIEIIDSLTPKRQSFVSLFAQQLIGEIFLSLLNKPFPSLD